MGNFKTRSITSLHNIYGPQPLWLGSYFFLDFFLRIDYNNGSMRRKFLSLFLVLTTIISAFPGTVFAEEPFNPHFLVSDDEMTDIFAMSHGELQTFLNRGALGSYIGTDVLGRRLPAADIIWQESQRFGINPQFLLALLQREQSLVLDKDPTEKQLDWAMGYAICDDCSMNDPLLQKYKGFGKQVHHAAKRIRESYLADLAERGETISGVGPGKLAVIDGQPIFPANKATAVLYTYTPHLHGNKNFVRIWNKWFHREYPSGSLLQDASTGGIFLIQFGKKRPITSRTAFYTRFNPNQLITVKPSELESYENGAPISFPNYSLLRSPRGTVYLLVDDTIRGIASMEAFRQIGFNPDELVDVTDEDLAPYAEGPPITVETKNPQGLLLQDPRNGGIVYVKEEKKHPIFSREVLDNRFAGWPINPGKPETLDTYSEAEPVKLKDGTLAAVPGSPDVFIIADGTRRHITDEETFLTYAYKWTNIVWTNERTVLLHPLGEPLTLDIELPEETGIASL